MRFRYPSYTSSHFLRLYYHLFLLFLIYLHPPTALCSQAPVFLTLGSTLLAPQAGTCLSATAPFCRYTCLLCVSLRNL
ncbi:hypothetical protein B0H10DRAFT_1975904, partial [Mycena sp. CBHHK59/15]